MRFTGAQRVLYSELVREEEYKILHKQLPRLCWVLEWLELGSALARWGSCHGQDRVHPSGHLLAGTVETEEANYLPGVVLFWPSSFTKLSGQFGFDCYTFKSPQDSKRLDAPFHCLCFAAYAYMANGTSQYI